MKNAIFSLLMLALPFAACQKEDTFESQLVGKWRSTQVKVGGVDVTTSNIVELDFEDTFEFEATVTAIPAFGEPSSLAYSGDWESDNEKEEIKLFYDNGQKEKYDITQLDETTMKASVIVEGVRREFVFERKN